ncbi:MAG: biosynthetic arginine decarboxylase [Trueperaceae bacterium]|nr:biosynthetic arginine decarboxylase [Trueperaceae bacterium]
MPNPSFDTNDAAELYSIRAWGAGYFDVNTKGQLTVSTDQTQAVALDEIVQDLVAQGHNLPIILRFPQLLEDRLDRVNTCFQTAIKESGFQGNYQGVYPIKVNQRRMIVETIAEYGAKYRTGLEAGSKAELALILVQDIHEEALICCNGFKDDDFVRMALWGRKLGKNVVITLEKYSELDRVLRISEELEVKPAIGVRFKLHAKGSGQWESSGGDDAKFGLTATELISVATRLQNLGLSESLLMLHCHVGSQLTDIRKIRQAVREAAQTYVELFELGIGLKYLNVGGGLAVDYDGSKTTFTASANYGLQEYANTVVWTVLESCNEYEAPHPIIVTESGRALTAHHAVVIMPVIDALGPTQAPLELPPLAGDVHSLVKDLQELENDITVKTYRESYNEAVSVKDTMHNLFDLGYLSLLERAHIENLYNRILLKVARVVQDVDYVPEEFENLPKLLADKYVCNFSLFQSLPDHWAIGQLFPIVPIGRLNEEPKRQATLVDVSCDSDGKITKFIDLRDVKATLPVHDLREGEAYHLGIFLTGAYQDVLGNAHNLFGRVNEAHIRLTDKGYKLELFVPGQKARRVIENMGYETSDLHKWLLETIAESDIKLPKGQLKEFIKLYDAELVGYTYLEQM